MIVFPRFILSLLLVASAMELVGAPMSAQDTSDSKTLDCRGWTTKVLGQQEMNLCAGRDADTQREKLQKLVGELRDKLSAREPDQWAHLEANQESWRDFVERDCKWEAAFSGGGSIQALVHARCLADATARRIARLRIFLCEGEGLAGECPESKRYE